jgi:hypothetical protein
LEERKVGTRKGMMTRRTRYGKEIRGKRREGEKTGKEYRKEGKK